MRETTASSNAVDGLSRAKALYSQLLTPENTSIIRAILEEALANSASADPHWLGEAWSLYADVLTCDYLNRWNNSGPVDLARADEAVQRAFEIFPGLAVAHYANGFIRRAKGEHDSALAAFNETLRLNPKFVRAYAQKGNELINVGRPMEALPLVEKAIQLSRGGPAVGMFYWISGRAWFFCENYDNAAEHLEKSVRMRSNLWYNRLYLVSANALMGRTSEAAAALTDFNNHFPGYNRAQVISNETANPNSHPIVVRGREKFHEGLCAAGLV